MKTLDSRLARLSVLGTLILSAFTFSACTTDRSESPAAEEVDEASDEITSADLVGKWKFVFEGARREAIQAEVNKEIKDPAKRKAAMAEADREAEASEVEFTESLEFVSRVYDKELMRTPPLKVLRSEGNSFVFETPSKEGPTGEMEVKLAGDTTNGDMITMMDPRKGPLTFRRVIQH